jgi:hypothetical protein
MAKQSAGIFPTARAKAEQVFALVDAGKTLEGSGASSSLVSHAEPGPARPQALRILSPTLTLAARAVKVESGSVIVTPGTEGE